MAYSYDNNGNRLGEVDALTGDFKTYQYNAKNRLMAANTLSDTLGFQYDISGIRTAKTVNGQTTTYLVDHNRDYAQVLIEDTVGATTRYTYGHDLLSQQASNDRRYYLYDGLGSTRALADETGAITDSYEYSAYGTELSQSGATANAYRYTGEQLDEETGLYYLRARYLDPVTGFTQLDSYQGRMQEPVTLHKYLYANGAPSMWTDPSGNMTLGELLSTLDVQGTLQAARAGIANRQMKRLVWDGTCFIVEQSVEEIVFQGLTEGLYLLWDIRPGFDKPYAGQSKDLKRRLREHVKNEKTTLNRVFARFPVSIKAGVTDKIEDVLDAMEQFLIDELKDPNNNPPKGDVANLRNQIDVDNPARSKAKAILEKIKLCK